MKLRQNEALYLADTISIHVEPPPDPVRGHPYPEMMVKIMRVVIEHADAEGKLHEAEADFTLDELMLVYEHAKSSVVISTENVGLNLLVKASREILALKEEKTILDEHLWKWDDGMLWELEGDDNDDAEPNKSDAENGAPDDTDKTIPA